MIEISINELGRSQGPHDIPVSRVNGEWFATDCTQAILYAYDLEDSLHLVLNYMLTIMISHFHFSLSSSSFYLLCCNLRGPRTPVVSRLHHVINC